MSNKRVLYRVIGCILILILGLAILIVCKKPENTFINRFWDDVVKLVGVVGALGSATGLILLFVKDQNKQAQLDELKNISKVLNNQSEKIGAQNELLSQQIKILTEAKGFPEDQAVLQELKEIEIKKLKLSVAPALWLNGAGYKGFEKRIYIDLNNKGERAILKEFNLLSGDIELVDKSLPFDLEKGEQRYIHAVTNNIHPKDASYEIEVLYEDVIQTQFRMIIGGKGERARIISNHEVG